MKKACQTRWLSFDASVTAALQSYEAILLSLQEIDDATAIGLISKLKQVKFIGTLYNLNAILPVLASLSRQFQAGNFHFSMIRPAVNRAISSLEALEETIEPLEKLKADIDSFTDILDELKWGKDTGRQLQTPLTSYIKALCYSCVTIFCVTSVDFFWFFVCGQSGCSVSVSRTPFY